MTTIIVPGIDCPDRVDGLNFQRRTASSVNFVRPGIAFMALTIGIEPVSDNSNSRTTSPSAITVGGYPGSDREIGIGGKSVPSAEMSDKSGGGAEKISRGRNRKTAVTCDSTGTGFRAGSKIQRFTLERAVLRRGSSPFNTLGRCTRPSGPMSKSAMTHVEAMTLKLG